jgi:hypothetical protein
MALIGRIFVVIFAYLVACFVAAFVLLIASRSVEWDEFLLLSMHVGTFWPLVCVAGAFLAAIVMIPAMLFIALTEGLGWRSVLLFAGFGALLALSSLLGFAPYDMPLSADGLFTREREILVAAGIAGGLTYWLIAGRNAGAWRELPSTANPPSLSKPPSVG